MVANVVIIFEFAKKNNENVEKKIKLIPTVPLKDDAQDNENKTIISPLHPDDVVRYSGSES